MVARFIEDVRIKHLGRDAGFERLPDGRTILVFREHADGRIDGAASGPRTRAHRKLVTNVSRIVMVQLKPGWTASVLGVAAHTLTDRSVWLDDVIGEAAQTLCRTVMSSDDIAGALASAFDQSLQRESSSARLARRASHLLQNAPMSVEAVASHVGVTSRHLRRAFAECIGVAPRDFARSVRLQRALEQHHSQHDWGRIAADVGYYDQAHLIDDFHALVGETPVEFAKRAIPPH